MKITLEESDLNAPGRKVFETGKFSCLKLDHFKVTMGIFYTADTVMFEHENQMVYLKHRGVYK